MKSIGNSKKSRRWISFLITVCFVIGLFPAITMTVNAASLTGLDYTNGILAERLDTIFNAGISSGISTPFPAANEMFPKSKLYKITFSNTGSQWSGYQCAAYAKAVYNYLFGYDPASERYRQTFSEARTRGSLSFEDFQTWGVEFGAYLRTTINSSGSYDAFSGHSVIILSYDEAGVTTLEANLATSTLYQVQIKSRTWTSFNNALFKNRYVCSLSQPLESIYADLDYKGNAHQCQITFDPNGGSVSPTTKTLTAGTLLTDMPTPTRNGYTFLGWAVSRVNPDSNNPPSTVIVSDGVWTFDEDTTLYALWTRNCANHTYDAEVCTNCGATLSYDNMFDASAAGTYQVSEKTAYVRTGPYQVKDLIRTMSRGETLQIVGSVINSYNNTWLKTADGYYVHADKLTWYRGPGPQSYYVILDNGSVCNRITVTNGGTYGNLPTPTKEGYTFDGWYTSSSGGTRVVSTTTVNLTGNQTLYAHWTKEEKKIEPFSCNVKISCINGKVVNLYNNPGDSKRVDYFSLGQSVGSQYGVNMPDGSTWYQVSVTSLGNVITVWLKYESDKMTVRPASDSVPNNDTPQYFNCNVGIYCVKGKTVNLYNNPGDSKRVDYFSLGQAVGSSYGVNMPDGTTWYQVSVTSKGNVITVWLKYESDKMTIKNFD